MRIRVGPQRPWGFVSWLPIVVHFGYLSWNRWWLHNCMCKFPRLYRLRYGRWPLYWYWRKGIKPPDDWHV